MHAHHVGLHNHVWPEAASQKYSIRRAGRALHGASRQRGIGECMTEISTKCFSGVGPDKTI